MALVGVLAFTQEFRYGTITSTYLGEPRRPRVLVAKACTGLRERRHHRCDARRAVPLSSR